MQLLVRIGTHHLAHELQKVAGGVPVGHAMENVPGGHFEGSVEIHNPVALVVVGMANGAPRAQGERPLRALQRLD